MVYKYFQVLKQRKNGYSIFALIFDGGEVFILWKLVILFHQKISS